ncbi:unnamed protein product [Vicia faba]|uniref:F-box associated domain-containing protein n=1 Tax=Vicia faba TaxID=3906 RepID=A0AAV1A5V4_VICFA|nr:unnamed protein product [Vicia faba]
MSKTIELAHWIYPLSFAGFEVYVDGACHWLIWNTNIEEHIKLTLLSFDLSDEAFITTPIGEEFWTSYTYNRRLVVLNGSIALISNYDDDIVFHISILGELGVTESWIKLYIYGPFPSLEWPHLDLGRRDISSLKKQMVN